MSVSKQSVSSQISHSVDNEGEEGSDYTQISTNDITTRAWYLRIAGPQFMGVLVTVTSPTLLRAHSRMPTEMETDACGGVEIIVF